MFSKLRAALLFIWKIHKKPILFIGGFHLLLAFAFYFLYMRWPQSVDPNRVFFRSGIYGLMAFTFGLLYFCVAAYVGFLLNLRRTNNWVLELPFSRKTLFLVSRVLMFGYALILFLTLFPVWKYAFWNWGQSTSYFVIFLPFLVYAIFQSTSPALLSFVVAIGSVLTALIFQVYFTDWIKLQWQFEIELMFLSMTFIVLFALEKKSKRLLIFDASLFIFIACSMLAYNTFKPVRTFEDAAKKAMFYPTAYAIHDFKKFATTTSLWRNEPYTDEKSNVYYEGARDLAHLYLDTSERSAFLKNVIKFHSNFEYKWIDGNVYDAYPLLSRDLSADDQKYLIDHWQDSKIFCDLFPLIPSAEALDRLFNSTCTDKVSTWFRTNYYPQRNGPFEKLWEEKLLTAHEKASDAIKHSLSIHISAAAGWDNRSSPFFTKFNGPWLMWRAFTKEDLRAFKITYNRENREKAAALVSKGREDFLKAIRNTPSGAGTADPKALGLLGYMCHFVSKDCERYSGGAERKSLRVFLESKDFFPGYNSAGIYSYYREVIKPEYWEELKRLAIPID